MPSTKSHISFLLTLLAIVWGILVAANTLRAQWTPPTSAPPNGNPASFLTTGSNSEEKTGVLTLRNNFYVIGSGLVGKVGIGTTTIEASSRLVVEPYADAAIDAGSGSIRTSWQAAHNDDVINKSYLNSAISGNVHWALSGNNLYASSTAYNVAIGTTTAGTAKLAVMGGNVGIGTTAPGAKLDVSSGYNLSGDTYGLRSLINPGSSLNGGTHRAIYGEALQGGFYTTSHTVIGVQGLAGRLAYAGGTESIGVLGRAVYNENHAYMNPGYNLNGRMIGVKSEINVTYANTGTDHLKGAYGFYAKGLTVSGTNVANWYGLYISPTSLSSGGTITNKYGVYQEESSALNYFAGNIGIGTTSPTVSLHVEGNAIADTPLQANHLATKSYVDTAAQSLWVNSGDHLYASSTSWRVGIGTTSPASALHIYPQNNIEGLRIVSSNYSPLAIMSSSSVDLFRVDQTGKARSSAYCDIDGNNCFNPDGGWSTDVTTIFLTSGTTSGSFTYTGGYVGYDAGNKICNNQQAGSHFCRTDEIMYLIQKNGASSFSTINGQDAWIADGPPGFTGAIAADDCSGWTNGTTSYLGHFWIFNSSGGGKGALINCETAKKIACCK